MSADTPKSPHEARPVEPDARRISFPPDVSLHDLWQNTPARYLIWLAGAAVFIFSLGITAGQLATQHGLSFVGAPEAPGGPGAKPAMSTGEPATSIGEAVRGFGSDPREALRASDLVSQINVIDNNLSIDRISPGKYGYTYGHSVANYLEHPSQKIRLSVEDDLYHYEVHKRQDGTLILIGFIAPSDLTDFSDPTRRRRDFRLLSHPFDDALLPVSIKLDDIEDWTDRDLPSGKPSLAEVRLRSPPS